MATRSRGALIAFLCCAIAIVGLTGIFATYAVPIAFERQLARLAALDEVDAAAGAPDPQTAVARLADRLGDSAAAVAPGSDLPARIASERTAMLARLNREAAATERQLRLLIGVVTLMAAAFGAAMLGSATRGS